MLSLSHAALVRTPRGKCEATEKADCIGAVHPDNAVPMCRHQAMKEVAICVLQKTKHNRTKARWESLSVLSRQSKINIR